MCQQQNDFTSRMQLLSVSAQVVVLIVALQVVGLVDLAEVLRVIC